MEPEKTVDSCTVQISIKTALKSSEASQQYNAMINEVKPILKNYRFDIVDRLTCRNAQKVDLFS